MNAITKIRLSALLLVLSAVMPGRVTAQPFEPLCPPNRPPESEHFSARGFGRQLCRGLTNVAFFWLEVPYQVKVSLAQTCPYPEWGPFTSTAYFVNGLASGTIEGVFRGVTGVFEVVLSPFPPYNSANCPPWPPYIGPREPVPPPGPPRPVYP